MTAPTHYSVQPFGLPQPPQGLSLQLQAPVVARTINIAPGLSQLNKSAMPFKPAQQQPQQNTLQVGVPLLAMLSNRSLLLRREISYFFLIRVFLRCKCGCECQNAAYFVTNFKMPQSQWNTANFKPPIDCIVNLQNIFALSRLQFMHHSISYSHIHH